MSKSFIYRVDGGHQIGMGHIFRAKALSKELQHRGMHPVILTLSPHYIVDEVLNWGVEVYIIPEKQLEKEYILSLCNKQNAHLVVQDVRDTDKEIVDILKARQLKLVHFDDLGVGRDSADVLIDANLPPEKMQNGKNNPVHLFGKDYMVLDPAFAYYNKIRKVIQRDVKKIIVSLGGSDLRGLTGWVADILAHHNISWDVTVVQGKGAHNTEKIQEFCEEHGFTYLYNISTMADLLYTSDLAIISGGITLYETATIGTPAVVLPQVDHQFAIGKKFEEEGAALCPQTEHDRNEEKVFNAIRTLCDNQQERKKMSDKGKILVDGQGVYRIAEVIEKLCSNKN